MDTNWTYWTQMPLDQVTLPPRTIKCCSPRGKSLSSRILQDQFISPCPCPWTSGLCPWTTESLKIFKDFAFRKLSIMYDHVTSINSVTARVHEDTVKNVLLTDVRYYLLMSASKPFFTVTQCCCTPGKFLSLSLKSLSLSSSHKPLTPTLELLRSEPTSLLTS